MPYKNTATRICALAAATGLLAVATACGEDPPSSVDPTRRDETPNLTAPAPTELTPEEQAQRAAENTVTAYHEILDGLFADPNRSIDELDQVADSIVHQQATDSVKQARAEGRTQTGKSTVSDFELVKIDINPKQPDNGIRFPTIVIRSCRDVRDIDAFDANGEPITVLNWADEFYMEYNIIDIAFPDGDKPEWRIVGAAFKKTNDDPPETLPCP